MANIYNWRIKSILKYKSAPPGPRPNFLLIPVTRLVYNDDDVAAFNKVYKEMLEKAPQYTPIVRTSSGGISNNLPPSQLMLRWDVRESKQYIELTVINFDGCWRIQLAPGKKSSEMNPSVLSGSQAYNMFCKKALTYGINLKSDPKYIVDKPTGLKLHNETEKPLIMLSSEKLNKDKTFYKVHHVDFHSSYPAGLVNTHPEFREFINHLYQGRKRNPTYKDMLNFSIGFMHSNHCSFRNAQLSKDAIKDSNDRVKELAKRIILAGGNILLYNTDGFWYQMNEPYHGDGEGDELGQWHNDHINCKFRAKSRGAYEFIEDGKYYPVVRGYTSLDKIKNREAWVWGDIYQKDAEPIKFIFFKDKGVVKVDFSDLDKEDEEENGNEQNL